MHVVPEVLRGKPSRMGGQQAGEGGLAVPVSKLQLAGGAERAVQVSAWE